MVVSLPALVILIASLLRTYLNIIIIIIISIIIIIIIIIMGEGVLSPVKGFYD